MISGMSAGQGSRLCSCAAFEAWLTCGSLLPGDKYTFTIEEGANGANGRISVNYDGFVDDVSVGDILLIDGGINSLKILSVDGKDVVTEVVDGGMMKSR